MSGLTAIDTLASGTTMPLKEMVSTSGPMAEFIAENGTTT